MSNNSLNNLTEYHARVKSGNAAPGHGKRGPDKKPRKGPGMKSFEKRYYDRTGRTIFQDMNEQMEEIQEMKELAKMCNDPEEKFKMLKEVNSLRQKYNAQWAPYLQAKKGVIQTDVKEEELESLDDILGDDDDNERY